VDTVRRAALINNSRLENDGSGCHYLSLQYFLPYRNSRVGVLAVVWAITVCEKVFDIMRKSSLCELWMTLKAKFVNFCLGVANGI
jgi:hypothetical protein